MKSTSPYGIQIGPIGEDLYQKGEDFTRNGQCSRCGGCCTHHLGVTKKERETIHQYIKEHNLKPFVHRNPNGPSVDFLCPFLDNTKPETSCSIYPVRPLICRAYRCDLPEPVISKKMEQLLKENGQTPFDILSLRDEINMQQEFFPETFCPKAGDLVIVNQVHMLLFQKHQKQMFYVEGTSRNKKGRKELLIYDRKSNPLWLDEKGLSKVFPAG